MYTTFKSKQKSGSATPTIGMFPSWDDLEAIYGSLPSTSSEFAKDSLENSRKKSEDPDNNADSAAGTSAKEPEEHGRLSSKVWKKRKVSEEETTMQKDFVNIQRANLEVNKKRLESEKDMMEAMSSFFVAGAKYFDAKQAKLDDN